jgi:hypothetical protein
LAVVGAPQAGGGAGAAFVFRRTSDGRWEQHARLGGNKEFGSAVAVEAGIVAVGAPGEDAVYLFAPDQSGAYATGERIASPFEGGARFGVSLALCGECLIVGAPAHSPAPSAIEAGGAMVMCKNGSSGRVPQILMAADPDAGDRFGWSVDCRNGRFVVGAPEADGIDNTLTDSGATYVFALTDAGLVAPRATLTAKDPIMSQDRNPDNISAGRWM